MIELSIPEIGESAENVKDRIITILSDEYPLTIMQLFNKIKKNYNLSITYQAVRKAVDSLIRKKILIKDNKLYKIDKEWILETKSFFDSLLLRYEQGKRSIKIIPDFLKENYAVYTFDNLLALDVFWGDVMLNWINNLKDKEPKEYIACGHYAWWMLINLGRETKIFNDFKENKINSFFLLLKDNNLNQWAVNIYRELDLNSQIFVDESEDEMMGLNIMGDNIIQVYYDKKILNKLQNFFANYKNINDANIESITKLANEKCNLKFVFYRDKNLAKSLRELHKKKFRKE